MSGGDTRQKYKAALEIIARSECAHPEQVAQDAIYTPGKQRLKRWQIMVGDRFGRLEAIYDCGVLRVTALDRAPRKADRLWLLWCDCGRLHFAKARSLVADATRSCGCLRSQMSTTAARINAYNRGHNFPARLARAINKLRKAAQVRKINDSRRRERDKLEATKRRLIPYAGDERRAS